MNEKYTVEYAPVGAAKATSKTGAVTRLVDQANLGPELVKQLEDVMRVYQAAHEHLEPYMPHPIPFGEVGVVKSARALLERVKGGG